MSLSLPESMDECVYFTNRSLLNDKDEVSGKIVCWAGRLRCPKCKKGWMTKPWDEKGNKFKVRATEFVCRECSYSEEKKVHEAKLTAHAIYTCPSCKKEGEGSVPYARKTFQGVKAILFHCQHCAAPIPVTKKLKAVKKKKGKKVEVDPEDLEDEDDF